MIQDEKREAILGTETLRAIEIEKATNAIIAVIVDKSVQKNSTLFIKARYPELSIFDPRYRTLLVQGEEDNPEYQEYKAALNEHIRADIATILDRTVERFRDEDNDEIIEEIVFRVLEKAYFRKIDLPYEEERYNTQEYHRLINLAEESENICSYFEAVRVKPETIKRAVMRLSEEIFSTVNVMIEEGFMVEDRLHSVKNLFVSLEIPLDDEDIIALIQYYTAEAVVRDTSGDKGYIEYLKLFPIPNTIEESSVATHSIVTNFNLVSYEDLSEFLQSYPFFSYIARRDSENTILTDAEDLELLHERKVFLKPLHVEIAKRAGLDIQNLDEEGYKKLFFLLEQPFEGGLIDKEWTSDGGLLLYCFEEGAEVFGYERMFRYVDREDLGLHNAVHAIESIIWLYEEHSGLSRDAFWGQIMEQVARENRMYEEEGFPQERLNAVANSFPYNIKETLAIVQEYPHLIELQERAQEFIDDPQSIFNSWESLNRFSDLCTELQSREFFDFLEEMVARGDISEKGRRFYTTLAFHRDSKVSIDAIKQLAMEPERYLAAKASHTPEALHDAKKPSNYTDIWNLDLTAAELRDALIEGDLDRIQSHPALEIRYVLPVKDGKREEPTLQEKIQIALGERKKGNGRAREPKKLFATLNQKIKQETQGKLHLVKYLQEGAGQYEGLDAILMSVLMDEEIGLPQEVIDEMSTVEMEEYVAQIHFKSSAKGTITGNDTNNCMPFGDGKNTLYMFNPICGMFTLSKKKANGEYRTISQSLVTEDKEVGLDVPVLLAFLYGDDITYDDEVSISEALNLTEQQQQMVLAMQEAQREGTPLFNILPEDIVRNQQTVIACDSVEVAPNYDSTYYKEVIAYLYHDFFREYLARFGEEKGIKLDEFIIGRREFDCVEPFERYRCKLNTTVPLTPVSYSDKYGKYVFTISTAPLKKRRFAYDGSVLERSVSIEDPEGGRYESLKPTVPGVDLLTHRDALAVAMIESKAYADNTSLVQSLHNMENALIAKDINNAAKERANMSVKAVDDDGVVRGYVLAYEGKINDEQSIAYDDNLAGERVIYISDMASDLQKRETGLNLMGGFMELYMKNYLAKGDMIPIYAQAREQTSYQIINRGLENLVRRLASEGVDFSDVDIDQLRFEIEELPTYSAGGDTMHPVIIRPVIGI